jgi:CheY-like chemotaxis protein
MTAGAPVPEGRGAVAKRTGISTHPGVTNVATSDLPPRRTVLIVDDNRDTADMIARLLAASGYPVIAAYSAQDGLDQLDACRDVGLVVSDIRMPGLDGFDLLRVVKHRFPSLPMVLTTGLPITDADLVPHGALILRKPFAVDALRRAVSEQMCADAGGGSPSA